MDIVYPYRDLGTGGEDLIYSLRSIDKNLKGWGKIHLAGDFPSSLKVGGAINHIETGLRKGKFLDVVWNIFMAAKQGSVDDFILMHDDIFFLNPMDVEDIQPKILGDLHSKFSRLTDGVPYKTTIKNTITWLEDGGYPTRDYGTHGPIPIKKNVLLELEDPLLGREGGVECKSLYGNYYGLEYEKAEYDFKIRKQTDLYKLHKLDVVSTNNIVQDRVYSLKRFLNKRFGEESEWE